MGCILALVDGRGAQKILQSRLVYVTLKKAQSMPLAAVLAVANLMMDGYFKRRAQEWIPSPLPSTRLSLNH